NRARRSHTATGLPPPARTIAAMTSQPSEADAVRLQVCAHRHGNDLELLSAAEKWGGDFVEVTINLFRNELDPRHEKTVGPLPIVWDRRRWPAWNPPRQRFGDVLA